MGRAEEARGRMARERATAPAQALAQTVSHDEESRNAIVLLLLTIGGATLAHRGFHLLANCRKVEIVKPAKVAKVVVKATRAKKAAPAPVVEEKKDRLEKYLRAWTVASDGPPLPASEFMKGIQAHWASNYRGEPVPTACALGKALVLLYRKDKKNGKQCYFAKLRKVMIAA